MAALSSGDPEHPHARGEVVIDTTTLAVVLGADAAAFSSWPRLHLTDSLDHALTLIEEQLLHRSRILDQHSLSDLDTLRQGAAADYLLQSSTVDGVRVTRLFHQALVEELLATRSQDEDQQRLIITLLPTPPATWADASPA